MVGTSNKSVPEMPLNYYWTNLLDLSKSIDIPICIGFASQEPISSGFPRKSPSKTRHRIILHISHQIQNPSISRYIIITHGQSIYIYVYITICLHNYSSVTFILLLL